MPRVTDLKSEMSIGRTEGNDLVLKFKQQGRGGEADVVMTLSAADRTPLTQRVVARRLASLRG